MKSTRVRGLCTGPRLLEALGVCVFIVSIGFVLIFAEGYIFDPSTSDLVKRGIIVIERVSPKGAHILLDGVMQPELASGEMRTNPGVHHLTIAAPGYHAYQKTLSLNDTTVLRIKPVMLVPEVLPGSLYTLSTLSTLALSTRIHEIPGGIFVTRPHVHAGVAHDLSDPGKLRTFELPFQYVKVLPGHNDVLFGLDPRSEIFRFEDGKIKRAGEQASDIAILEDGVVSIGFDGTVARWDSELTPKGASFIVPKTKSHEWQFAQVREGGDFVAMLTNNKVGETLLTVIDSEDRIFVQVPSVRAFTLVDSVLTYIHEGTVTRVNLERPSETASRKVNPSIIWFSPIGESNHILSMRVGGQLQLCDSDAENCSDLVLKSETVPAVSQDLLSFGISSHEHLQALVFEGTGNFSEVLERLDDFGEAFAREGKSS